MRAGPKSAGSTRALPAVAGEGVDGLDAWLRRWVKVPRGTGAGGPLVLRPYQRAIAADVLDPEVGIVCWVCARGNAKSATASALGLHHICEGPIGAKVAVVATDERAAARVLKVATAMVTSSEPLSKRIVVYADRLVCERTGSEFLILPAEMRRIEGLDADLLVADEVGLMERDIWESLLNSMKAEGSTTLAIGTPSPPAWRDRAPLLDLVTSGRVGDDPTLRLHEFGSDLTHPVTCDHCARSANPGYGDILPVESIRKTLPPKTREAEYRRARLAQWIETDSASWLTAEAWDACAEPHPVPDGADVVLALDGSFNGDSTALVVATVGPRPHLAVAGLWEQPSDDPDWRVEVEEVEAAIRTAARRWRVVEVAMDPYRWTRSEQVLRGEGLPMVEFPQSAARMTPATVGLTEAVINRQVTHDGDVRLRSHVLNAAHHDDRRGVRITKVSKHSRRRIDLAVSSIMAHARATWHARKAPPKRRRVYSW